MVVGGCLLAVSGIELIGQVKGAKALELEKNRSDPKISGFEEFYAEPPMRPEEAEEEELLYDPKHSVATSAPPFAPLPFSLFVHPSDHLVAPNRLSKSIVQHVASTLTENASSPPISPLAASALSSPPLLSSC